MIVYPAGWCCRRFRDKLEVSGAHDAIDQAILLVRLVETGAFDHGGARNRSDVCGAQKRNFLPEWLIPGKLSAHVRRCCRHACRDLTGHLREND